MKKFADDVMHWSIGVDVSIAGDIHSNFLMGFPNPLSNFFETFRKKEDSWIPKQSKMVKNDFQEEVDYKSRY